MSRPLHIAFAPWMVAGIRTQWENMLPTIGRRRDIVPHIVEIQPYKAGGRLEAIPGLPASVKGNLRSLLCGAALFRGRIDALWTQDMRAIAPFALTSGLVSRVPVVWTADSTSSQQAAQRGFYAKAGNESPVGRARDALERAWLRRATVANPWSEWAAGSMRDDYGLPARRVRVIPPGVDLARWPFVSRQRAAGQLPRLLFVGGDFRRKGGDLLLDVYRERLRERCELHLVTRDQVQHMEGVSVYRDFMPNDPRLRDLYASCHVFVLPTRADCFSLASMEAMSTGLPVIVSRVGGIAEIVEDGRSGFLIEPDDAQALTARIQALLDEPELCTGMGLAGRRRVEERFDAARNTDRLLDLIVDLVPLHTSGVGDS